MKFKAFFAALIGGALMMGSCNPSTPATPATPAAEFKCKVDGVAISTASAAATLQGGNLGIAATFDNGKSVIFSLSTVNAVTPTTHALTVGGTKVCAYTASTGALAYTSNYTGAAGGSITVTSVDTAAKTMTGTFTCGLRNLNGAVSLTEGVFTNIPYSVATPTGGNNAFACTIDGVAFAPTQKTAILTSGIIGITGTLPSATAQKSVALFLPSGAGVGTYDLQLFGDYVGQYQTFSGTTATIYNPKAGAVSKVTISNHNTTTRRIQGTFYGVFAPPTLTGSTVNITAGSFDVTY